MNKLKKSLNKTMGYLPLEFQTPVFKEYVNKIQKLHPYSRMIVEHALYSWERQSDAIVENGVTKNYFEGDYSNVYFYKNLETIVRELKFTTPNNGPRKICPTWLFKMQSTGTYANHKATRSAVTSPSAEAYANNLNDTNGLFFNLHLTRDSLDGWRNKASKLPIFYNESKIEQFPQAYPDGSITSSASLAYVNNNRIFFKFNEAFASSLIPVGSSTIFYIGSFMDLVFNAPKNSNERKFLFDLMLVYAFFNDGRMSMTSPLNLPYTILGGSSTLGNNMTDGIDAYARNLLTKYNGDKTKVFSETLIESYYNDPYACIVDNKLTYKAGRGYSMTLKGTDARCRLKPMAFIINVLEQAIDFLKWAESDNFDISFTSNFDSSKIENNESFISNQLNFMNSLTDKVQEAISNERQEWQDKKDSIKKEIEEKKQILANAIKEKRAVVLDYQKRSSDKLNLAIQIFESSKGES